MNKFILLAIIFGINLSAYADSSLETKEIKKLLLKKEFNYDDTKKVCSTDIKLNLTIQDLPKEKWNSNLIKAIGCLNPIDEDIHLALLTYLEKDLDYRSGSALLEIASQHENVQLSLAQLILKSEESFLLAEFASMILAESKPRSLKVHRVLKNILTEGNTKQRKFAIWALAESTNLNTETIYLIAKSVSDIDFDVKIAAAKAMQKIKSNDEEIHLILIAGFASNPEGYIDVALDIAVALKVSSANSAKVQQALADVLRNGSDVSRGYAAMVLGEANPREESIQLALAEGLINNWDFGVELTVRALRKTNPKHESVKKRIIELGHIDIL